MAETELIIETKYTTLDALAPEVRTRVLAYRELFMRDFGKFLYEKAIQIKREKEQNLQTTKERITV